MHCMDVRWGSWCYVADGANPGDAEVQDLEATEGS